MSDEEINVIQATLRPYKLLVDKTLSITLHIEPRFIKDFHRIFPDIDVPVAIAPLSFDFDRKKIEEKPKGGPLAQLAGQWCKQETFRLWLSGKHHGEEFTEEDAAQWIRDVCRVKSRSEIDSNEVAGRWFRNSVRWPYMEWMKGNLK